MATEPSVVETGTTTVGLRTADGVVLAADRRASLGGRFVSNKDAVKIEQVHPSAAVTISGSVGGGQAFVRQLRSQADLYESRRGRPMPVSALATAAGNAIRGMSVMPVLGGVDPAAYTGSGTPEPHVYMIDPAGGVLEDDYTATGSGTTLAIGTLERSYRENLSLEEGVDLAVEAVASALERDTASGNGVTIARITADGVSVDSYGTITEVRS